MQTDMNTVPNDDLVNAVTRMQQYIADHIKEPITQHRLAVAAGYSQFYSARIFKELTGQTPFEYIRKMRLSQSAMVLRMENVRVIDVALDFVFDSHEGFTRAFSKEFGITPKKYSKNPDFIKLFMPENIKELYLQNNEAYLQKNNAYLQKNESEDNIMSESAKTIFIQVVDRPARKLILKRGRNATHYFEFCEEVGCEVWDTLTSIKEALYEPIGMWMPDNLRTEGTSTYTQGVEVPLDYNGFIPDGFEIIELPPCKIMIFQGEPYDDENFMEEINNLWKQTANFKPEIYGFEWADDVAPKFQLIPMGYRGYIEGRPVKEVNRQNKFS